MRPRGRHLSRAVALPLVGLALLAAGSVAPRAADAAPNLVPNGSFRASLGGWEGSNARLARLRKGPRGRGAALVARRRGYVFAIHRSLGPRQRTRAGQEYRARVWVRSVRPGRMLCLRIRETAFGNTYGFAERCRVTGRRWGAMPSVRYRAAGGGHRLNVAVYAPGARRRDAFLVDGVQLDRVPQSGLGSLPNLVADGSFEGSLGQWAGDRAELELASDGVVDAGAARAAVLWPAQAFGVYQTTPAVDDTERGALYTAGAWLRSDRPGRPVCLSLRELQAGAVAGSTRVCMRAAASWQPFTPLTHAALSAGRQLDLRILALDAHAGDSFEVDGITLTEQRPPEPPPPPLVLPEPTCARVAATDGDDGWAGTPEAPFRTAQKLVRSLAPGQTGCLRAGDTFVEDVAVRSGGSPGAPITLTSSAGGRATLRGRLWIADSANDVVVANLLIDTRNADNLPSPTVNGDRVSFLGNDITNYNRGGICLLFGSTSGWGVAVDPVVEGNRIHNCGRRPPNNLEHGIYLQSTRNARIVGNFIYDNSTHAIQFYPDAHDSLVSHNVFDGNGQAIIFSGADGVASNDNLVVDNVISNSFTRHNVESWYPAGNPVGSGNVADRNCLWNGASGNVGSQVGFVARNNVVADPLFVNRAAKDFRLSDGSPCTGKGL